MAHKDSKRELSTTQERALHALVTRQPEEKMESVAERAGVSRRTLYRYLEDDIFYRKFQNELRMLFRGARFTVANALLDSATRGNPQNQKLYWQLTGLLSERLDVNVDPTKNNPSVETVMIDPETLTPEMRAALLGMARANQLPAKVEPEREEEISVSALDALDAIEIQAQAIDKDDSEINVNNAKEPEDRAPDLDLFAPEPETEIEGEGETLW